MADVKLSKLATKRLPSATALFTNNTTAASINLSSAITPSAGGALVANTWKEVLSLSTPGILHGAVVRTTGSTAKTVGIRITIDGVVVATSELGSASSSALAGAWAGMLILSSNEPSFGWAPFQTLKVEIRSNISTSEPTYGVYYTGLEV